MGALFVLFWLLVVFGLVYPALGAVVWVIERKCGSTESFTHFMKKL